MAKDEKDSPFSGRPNSSQRDRSKTTATLIKQLDERDKVAAKRNIILIAVVVVLWAFIWLMGDSETTVDEVVAPVYVERVKTTAEKIKDQFSGWDGSHRDFARRIREAMNDPSSFEHVSTRYVNKDDHIMVLMTYRGKNVFGATILDEAIGFYTIDGTYNGALTE